MSKQPLKDSIGDRIRRAREEKGLSQAALSRAADVPHGALAKIEAGAVKKSRYLPKLWDYVGLPLAELEEWWQSSGGPKLVVQPPQTRLLPPPAQPHEWRIDEKAIEAVDYLVANARTSTRTGLGIRFVTTDGTSFLVVMETGVAQTLTDDLIATLRRLSGGGGLIQ